MMASESGSRRRDEDPRLLTGAGRFTDDVRLPGQVHAVFLRSPHAHATIGRIDAEAAAGMPGVLGIFTGSGLSEAGLGDIPPLVLLPGRDGKPMFGPAIPVLAVDRVRYVGEPVVLVVAETVAQASDAAEAVAIDYEELLAASDVRRASEPAAPQLWPQAPGNVSLDWEHGEADAVEAALARATCRVSVRLEDTRVAPTALEPRAAIASWDAELGRYMLIAPTQGVSVVRKLLAESVFKVPLETIRVLTHDVGGGFGMKVQAYAEYAALLHAARRVGRPVRWCATRLESFLADTHGRDGILEGELGLDEHGRFVGLRVRTLVGIGAYASTYVAIVATNNTKNCLSSVYAIPAIHIGVKTILTNAAPLGPYRGAGRPEAIYLVERLIELAARKTGIDPVSLRRRNLIPATAMPYKAPSGQVYDSGEFEAVLDKALALADWQGFPERKRRARAAGRLRGIGLGCFLEVAGGAPLTETADLRFGRDGGVELRTGAQAMGQGQMTTIPLMLGRLLQIDPARVRVIQGDSHEVPGGIATVASRSTMMLGGAASQAVDEMIKKGKILAAEILEAAEHDIEYRKGRFRIAGTDRSVELGEIVRRGGVLDTVSTFAAPEMSFPNGCHVCEVEIDPETGVVTIVDYAAVDDVGNIVHEVIVEGQVHGGVAQGLGQVLGEQLVYSENGQLLTASLMDYRVPRANDLPRIRTAHHVAPCTTNPLGVKGAGESGVAGSIPSAVNAILDALADEGVTHLDLPMTPQRVWAALQSARRQRA
ncbi:xanthine dehydrogenase family protein molybdopterin-binding subunit [Zeimonas arvi]|uniref:Xanthine dehydrogenase family protein molybdopterin-binding subunit n=2 Tax=Zeimonas arvi TaxID=2498847 RepID=A0A5C8NYX4_9BURK|nr:xanthine dehydrogenase family protein molybdopterin-binding subunit [Zeimonas arvi]